MVSFVNLFREGFGCFGKVAWELHRPVDVRVFSELLDLLLPFGTTFLFSSQLVLLLVVATL